MASYTTEGEKSALFTNPPPLRCLSRGCPRPPPEGAIPLWTPPSDRARLRAGAKASPLWTDIPHIRLRVSKEPAILRDGDGRASTNAGNYPVGLTKPSLGAVN